MAFDLVVNSRGWKSCYNCKTQFYAFEKDYFCPACRVMHKDKDFKGDLRLEVLEDLRERFQKNLKEETQKEKPKVRVNSVGEVQLIIDDWRDVSVYEEETESEARP